MIFFPNTRIFRTLVHKTFYQKYVCFKKEMFLMGKIRSQELNIPLLTAHHKSIDHLSVIISVDF